VRKAAALSLALALVVAGCGGSGSSSSGSTTRSGTSGDPEAVWAKEVQAVMSSFENNVSATIIEQINETSSHLLLEPLSAPGRPTSPGSANNSKPPGPPPLRPGPQKDRRRRSPGQPAHRRTERTAESLGRKVRGTGLRPTPEDHQNWPPAFGFYRQTNLLNGPGRP
jgi:hypothetical protein